MTNDPVAELITKIKTATSAKKQEVLLDYSNLKQSILQVLKDEGYITDFVVKFDDKHKKGEIKITLKYKNNISSIENMRQISKPGLRVYSEYKKIPKVLNGLGTTIVSTSLGVMTDKQARKAKVGGEILAYVW